MLSVHTPISLLKWDSACKPGLCTGDPQKKNLSAPSGYLKYFFLLNSDKEKNLCNSGHREKITKE